MQDGVKEWCSNPFYHGVIMNKDEINGFDWFAMLLVIVGAINWGLYGLGYFLYEEPLDLVATVFGDIPWLQHLVYLLVGLAGVYLIYFAIKVTEPEYSRV